MYSLAVVVVAVVEEYLPQAEASKCQNVATPLLLVEKSQVLRQIVESPLGLRSLQRIRSSSSHPLVRSTL